MPDEPAPTNVFKKRLQIFLTNKLVQSLPHKSAKYTILLTHEK